MAAPQQYSSRGYILGGVTDQTPDWLGSYNEGVETAQQQKTTALNQQEAQQRMAENAAAEQRRATEFANQQADRARLEQAWAGQGGLPGLQTPEGPALGPMETLNIPAARAPSAQYAEELAAATPRGAGAITRDEFIKQLPEWARLEQANGLPNNYLETISMLESSGGVNTGTGQYTGIFQIGPEVAADFGVTPEQLRDPKVNAQVAAKLAGRNAAILRARLNREPQPWELYLAHQQGAGGAASLLQNPNGNVVDVLAGAYGGDRARAQQAVIQNGGDPSMTAGEFAQLWAQKFGGALPQPFTGGPGLQVEGEVPPSMVATPSPTASPLRNDINEFLAKRNRRDAYFGIIGQLQESPLRGVYDYLFSDQATAEQNTAQSGVRAEALQWYQSDATGAYFDANPAALAEAQRDPIAFYQQNKDLTAAMPTEATGRTDLPAGVTVGAPAAPAATVPPTPTPGLQVQPATDQQAIAAAQGIASDIVPSVTAEDYAGISVPGQGSMTQQIMRTPRGQTPMLPDSGLYIAEPAMISANMNELMVARQSLERRYNDALRFRDRETMAAIEDKVVQIDAGIRLMQNMQSIAALQGGDVNQISQTLSRLTGGQTRIQEVQPGGMFNIYQNGQLAYQNVPKEALIASLRSQFDQQYQAQVAAQATAAAEMDKEILKGTIETNREVLKQQADMYKQLAVERAKQQYNSDPANVEYAATSQTMADGSPVLILTPKRGGLPPQIWQLEPDVGVDGQPIVGPDGNPKLNWKQQSTGGISAVPVQ